MPLYIHLANLIILKSAIEKKYKGGIEKFRTDYAISGDNYNQEDEMLISIARMNIDEFDIDALTNNGLHFDEESQFSTDFTIKPRYGDDLWSAEWIRDNGLFTWHVNSNSASIKKAEVLGNMTMEKLIEMHENGENPFATILHIDK